MDHMLQCKKGGLVVACHNEIWDEVGYLATTTFALNVVCSEPFIQPVADHMEQGESAEPTCLVTREVVSIAKNQKDCSNLLICSLWTC